ncbi:sugar ABC transporter substrate-binding protein [Aquisalimonas lutea]|uniref:sugar ABC transporter substrate-binding protein n=1 Tax=Aquisalimonas lutea TaxID=1327750 RepID=UPI0025B4DA0E|nr:sugar ABC transporter substrate-binding protein [Aquisalimonas lutea]MDN3516571.1 sugar ABC transporter substrate-binding protein [Aquisalimonas lutea]
MRSTPRINEASRPCGAGTPGKLLRRGCAAVATLALGFGLVAGPAAAQDDEPYNIYLSMSYIGNDWQAEAKSMIEAMAKHPDYEDRVDLNIQVSGPNAQKQIQQINGMVQAGADAIVVYPISPNALNRAVRNACNQDVVVIAYDAEITEPCAYNVTIDQEEAGRVIAEWLAEELGGQGDIAMITGVPGTSVDTKRTEAAKEVFSQHEGIDIVAEAPGMWSQAEARQKLSQIMANRDWDDLDGLWMQVGCYTAAKMQIEDGVADEDVIPCAGEASNGHRVQMLPPGTIEGVDEAYRPIGYRSISYGSPPYSGALALKMAVAVLDGTEVPQRVNLPLPLARTGEMEFCEEGTWEEMANGCNVFDPNLVSPGWFADIYGPWTPEVGFQAALLGEPEDGGHGSFEEEFDAEAATQ